MPENLQAVLFDMDGTLVDSDAAVERAWTTWATEYDADITAVLAVAHGSPAESTVRVMRPDFDEAGVTVAAARQLELQYADLHDVVAAHGAHEVIEMLADLGIPWAVVTSADRRLALARLAAAGIDPGVLVTVDELSAGKPHPDGYLLAAHRLGVDPARCLVVEDAPVGVTAGLAAGATVAGLRGVSADLSIDDLGELADLLRGYRVAS